MNILDLICSCSAHITRPRGKQDFVTTVSDRSGSVNHSQGVNEHVVRLPGHNWQLVDPIRSETRVKHVDMWTRASGVSITIIKSAALNLF